MKKILLLLTTILALVGCTNKNNPNDKNLIIGASATPHALILENAAKPLLEKKGYKVTVKVINDYVTPNLMLNDGDLDANYFQHVPYLDDFNSKNRTNLKWACKVHFEPMGIYSSKYSDLSKTNPKVAIPNDTSNGKRARDLLASLNIQANIVELEAQALPSVLQDVDYAVINGNYALSSNILNKCLATEDAESEIAQTNANVIAVKNLDYSWVNDLKEAILSEEVKNYIQATFGSAVKAVF